MRHSRRNRPRRLAALGVIAAVTMLGACGHTADLTNPKTVADELRGTWTRAENVTGSSFTFTTAVQSDTLIGGVGTYSIEAGASGTMGVSGKLAGTQIQMTFVTDLHMVEHFNGTLVDENTLRGSFWVEYTDRGSDPVVETFVRVR